MACASVNKVHAQQMTDLVITGITLPPDVVPQIQPIGVQFTIANNGDADATNFFCGIQIFSLQNPSVPIFQNQVNVPLLAAGETQTLQSTQTWTPADEGEYIVQVAAVYEFDNTPSNNVMGKSFRVGQSEQLLTLQQAVAILNEELLDNHPRVDSLVALHISPPANPADSLIPPGLTIMAADSSVTLQYEYPVYFFFVDLYPDELFSHPVEYVAISAIDGTIDRRTDVELWPEIDGATPDFGSYCFGDANPRRVRGNARQCVEKANPYQPKATSNTGAWAVALVGKLNLDVEKSTVQHDICKWKERINGNSLGPSVTGPNITALSGTNNCGLTEEEFCAAIDGLKGKNCDKLHFKYVGHGTTSGLILWDDKHKTSKTLSWKDFACKLKDAGIGEACIEITACHSGAAIRELKKKGIKGTVITSSSSARTTPVGDGSGTHWEKALEACSKDQMADLNKNGKIDQCELYAWVKVKGGTSANGPNPQIAKLNDSITLRSVRLERVGGVRTISTNGGSIRVYAERICMRLSVKQGSRRRDSTVYRGSIYIENTGNTRKSANRDYSISARCGRENIVIVPRIRPSLGPGEKQCIAELPNNCTGISVNRLRNSTVRKDDGSHIVLSAAPDESLSTLDEFVARNPGDFAYYRYILEEEENTQLYTTSINGPNGWFASVEPKTFNIPETDSQDVFTGTVIPDTATMGGEVIASVVNTATDDTLLLRYNIFLLDTLRQVNSNEGLQGTWKWYDAVGNSLLKGFDVDLERVQIDVKDSLQIETVGGWIWKDVVVNADSGTRLEAAIGLGAGITLWENVAIRGTESGLMAEAGNITMRNVTVGGSFGSGITFRGNQSTIDTVLSLKIQTLNFVNVLGSRLYGFVFDDIYAQSGVVDTLQTHGLRVAFTDSTDLVVRNNSHVHCTDCEYDDTDVEVDPTSSLLRLGTVSIVAVDTAGIGLSNIDVTITSLLSGQSIRSAKTDVDGFVPSIPLPFSLNVGGNRQTFGPYEIVASNGFTEMRDTVNPVTWTQVFFDFTEGPASAPVAGERSGSASIIAIVPQPLSRQGSLRVETAGLQNGQVAASLHNTLGESVWRDEDLHVVNNRLQVEGFGEKVSSGVYVLRLHLLNGEFLSAKVIVR